MKKSFEWLAHISVQFAGHPISFVVALSSVVVWALLGPVFRYSDTWQLTINTGTTIVTFLIVFLIQNSQNRDNAAVQAKLSELIRAMAGAQDAMIDLEDLSGEQLQACHARYAKLAEDARRRLDGHGAR